jgi:hypothetical protein
VLKRTRWFSVVEGLYYACASYLNSDRMISLRIASSTCEQPTQHPREIKTCTHGHGQHRARHAAGPPRSPPVPVQTRRRPPRVRCPLRPRPRWRATTHAHGGYATLRAARASMALTLSLLVIPPVAVRRRPPDVASRSTVHVLSPLVRGCFSTPALTAEQRGAGGVCGLPACLCPA